MDPWSFDVKTSLRVAHIYLMIFTLGFKTRLSFLKCYNSSAAPVYTITQRGTTLRSNGGINYFYIAICIDQENSRNFFTSIVNVFTIYVYAYLYRNASLSFVTPYFAMRFKIFPEQLLEPFSVSTQVSNSILVE